MYTFLLSISLIYTKEVLACLQAVIHLVPGLSSNTSIQETSDSCSYNGFMPLVVVCLVYTSKAGSSEIHAHVLCRLVYRSRYKRTTWSDSKGNCALQSRCFLFIPLPFPARSLLMRTLASFQVAEPPSVSTDSNSSMPSFSTESASPSADVSTYLTYMGRSLKRSKSWGIRTTRSAPGDET